MSLTLGAFKVHFFVEKLIPTPFAINLQAYQLTQSRTYNQLFHKAIRYIILFTFAFLVIPFLIWRIIWLLTHWKSFTASHVDQLIVYTGITSAIAIFMAAWNFEYTHSQSIQYVLNQRCRLRCSSTSSFIDKVVFVPYFGKHSLKELFMYGFSLPFLFVNIGVIGACFAINYDPVQLVFVNLNVIQKLIVGLLYCVLTLYGQTTVLSAFLVAISLLEGIISYSSTIHFLKSPFSVFFKIKFGSCLKRYRVIQILTIHSNYIAESFLSVLGFVGILLASCAAFATLKMYNMVHVFTYILAPPITIFCFVAAILLTYMGDILHRNSQLFQRYWKLMVPTKERRKILRSCRPIGFRVVPYGLAEAKLGLSICDDIVRNTVTMLLLGVL